MNRFDKDVQWLDDRCPECGNFTLHRETVEEIEVTRKYPFVPLFTEEEKVREWVLLWCRSCSHEVEKEYRELDEEESG